MQNWIKAVLVGVLLGALVSYHFVTLSNARKEFEQRIELVSKDLKNKVKEKEGELLLDAQQRERKKDEEITRLNNYANNLLARMQQRPSRTEESNTNSSDTSSCTGRELFKEDGEFLVREAARADRILEERNYYYEQYEQVRKTLDEFNQSN